MLVVIFDISQVRMIGSKPNPPYTYRKSNAIVALDCTTIVTSRVMSCRHATLILLDGNTEMLEIAYITRSVFITLKPRFDAENDVARNLSIDNSCLFYKYQL